MAVFVDLDDEPQEPDPHQLLLNHGGPLLGWNGDLVKSLAASTVPSEAMQKDAGQDKELQIVQSLNRNGMTEALGAYPIAKALASSLDLNTLDNLSRTCRQVRHALLQYRDSLVVRTLRCYNDEVVLNPDDTFRYRARASNYFYVETGRLEYNGKSGFCARDLVAECRRCARVVCRNCAIKPPGQKILRDRHRRLCYPCTKAPLARLATPPLLDDTPINDELMQHALCTCQTEGVWLCQPCGRSIRSADMGYLSLWKWRSQYGDVIGGLGTGIGDGDRGVICGRDIQCCAAKEREQETDCDAEDARDFQNATPPPLGLPSPDGTPDRRTPSPQLGPGYARHEIEGIGGVVKRKRLTMVKIGACVPEFEDEKPKEEILQREISGNRRSWCGWCYRVIPGKKDLESDSTSSN